MMPSKREAVALGAATETSVDAVMGLRHGLVEAGAHFQLDVPLSIDQGEVDGDAARMGRAAAGIGHEFGIRQGVPQAPLRLGRAEGIEDLERAGPRVRPDARLSSAGSAAFSWR